MEVKAKYRQTLHPTPVDVLVLSVVIPVFNEEDSLPVLHDELMTSLSNLGSSFEIVYVDDGSTDKTWPNLASLADDEPRVKLLRFRRNFGQTAAIAAGFDHARGQIIVAMDADLQNDPRDIPKLLARIAEGYDVVSGWRKNRRDKALTRKIPSTLANRLISWVTGVHLHDYGCTLKAYRREIVESFRLYGEMHRFIPAYAVWSGGRLAEIPVNHRARRFGQSKYGITRTFKVLLDLATVKFLGGYAQKPLYLFGGIGIALLIASWVSGMVVIGRKLFQGVSMIETPLLLLTALLVLLGVQFILMGLLAEIAIRTYHESQGKSTYIVQHKVNFPST